MKAQPVLTSAEYAAHFNEAKSSRSFNRASRTAEPTLIVRSWASAMAAVICATLTNVYGQTHAFTALAKESSQGTAGVLAEAVRFGAPLDIAVDRRGNIFVAESLNRIIRKITPAGQISTFAGDSGEVGSADGNGSDARFDYPSSIVADAGGNLYVADDNTIRKISPAGVVTTLAGSAGESGFADGQGSEARFHFRKVPFDPNRYRVGEPGLAVDGNGNVFVADVGNGRIRKITPDGTVTTFAAAARFPSPERMAFDPAGNLFVIDISVGAIHKISRSGEVTTPRLLDGFTSPPRALAIDDDGNMYLAYGDVAHWDYYWGYYPVGYIEKITPAGNHSILAGSRAGGGLDDGLGAAANFRYPQGLALDREGNLYVADTINCLIRKVTKEGLVTTLASIAPTGEATPESQIVNASVRVSLRPPQPLVVSLDVQGSKPVLLRAIGPGLRPFMPVASLAMDPRLELYEGAATPVKSNDNWGGGLSLRDAFAAAGAFPLELDSSDGALLHTLEHQGTLQVTAAASGIALVEAYDLVPRNGSRVTKFRARHAIGASADDRLIAGFTVSGSEPKQVLIRGLGPALARPPYNAIGPLARATLSVFGSDGQLLADNNGWPSTLANLFARAGASPLEFGSKDAALSLVLSPGTYIAVLRGSNGAIGEGMLEIYDVQ